MGRKIWIIVLIAGALVVSIGVAVAVARDAAVTRGDGPTTVESNQSSAGAPEAVQRPAVEGVTDTRSPEERESILDGMNRAPALPAAGAAPAGPMPGTESGPPQ